MIQIYNTLTRKKEEFRPITGGEVKFYVCGPTVYDYFHIGNGRSFINADFIRRYLEYRGFKVTFIMNVTDVDDKIIKKANAEGVESAVIAAKYTQAFFEDLAKLGVKPATVHPKATEHMKEIIDIIKRLEEKGVAYNVNGDVFYDISRFNGYGKLSGKNIDELEAGSRVEVNEIKKHPLDFSLWKSAKPGEPFWESPWGNGRPGWHIECSAMSSKHLGETFDIHAGGSDLIFPHHENEIAQSEACFGKTFANYWIHFGFLNIDNTKMSKSLGNFFTVREILEKYPAAAIRLFFAQTHFSVQLNFTQEALEAAAKGSEKMQNLKDSLASYIQTAPEHGSVFPVDEYRAKFNEAMDDNFNTPNAVALLFDFIRDVNRHLDKEEKLSKVSAAEVLKFFDETAGGVLGLFAARETGNSGREDDVIRLLLEIRSDLKKEKNYRLSDVIRDRLKEIGIEIRDSKEGTTFRKL
ncbi:MAG: Cysteine--tRNA ligase [Ignavibacteriaceae bacterium]|nr:Cysteine--tRNA ligase [Ignavibacteriaceae bacterium]